MRVFSLLLLVGLVCVSAAPSPPDYPEYHVAALFRLPYAGIVEPKEVWLSEKLAMARVDDYDGQVSHLFRLDEGKNYQITPTGPTRTSCFVSNTTAPVSSLPTVFPDTTGFELQPTTAYVNGVPCANFTLTVTNFGRVNNYYYYIGIPNGKPVRYTMLGFDSLYGSHYDEYHIDYISVEPFIEEPSSVFADPPSMGWNCTQEGTSSGPSRVWMDMHMMHPNPHPAAQDALDKTFGEFKDKYSKKFESDASEQRAKGAFVSNHRFVEAKNRDPSVTFTLAVNHFADSTVDERRERFGNKMRMSKDFRNNAYRYHEANTAPPSSWDWRPLGAVGNVRDQAACGSCWSFGASGTLAGGLQVASKKPFRGLAPQAFVDCSWNEGNTGCEGGLSSLAYDYLLKGGNLPLASDYPYLGSNGRCHADQFQSPLKISGYVNVSSGNMTALHHAIATVSPIAVAIDASQPSFSFYSSGIYNDPACKNGIDELDHSVLAVGYQPGATLIQNSWSTHWGNQGYVLISTENNLCGVATQADYADVVA